MKLPPHLTPAVVKVMAAAAAVLLIASIVRFVLKRLKPQSDFKELHSRIRSWWVMAGLLLGSIIWGQHEAIVFLGFISFLALKEFLSLVPTRRADRRVLFWIYAAIPFQYAFIWTDWYGMFATFIPVYVFLLIPIRMVLLGQTKDFLKALGILHWGVMVCVFSLSHLAFLLVLPAQVNPAGRGAGLLLFVLLITEFNDVAQYIWGKTLGRRKVVPTVSPNKTWGGLLGGVLTSGALSYVLGPLLTPLLGWRAALMGAVLGVVGFFGDVTISAIKRDLQVKDSGNWIPGHGGILDRVDSLTFTAPFYFHLIHYWYY